MPSDVDYRKAERNHIVKLCFLIGGTILVLIAVVMAGMPLYSVWQQELVGKAELKRAEGNRQIKVQKAKAKDEAAKYLAEAEVTRAKGVAKANEIIGNSLSNELYLRYLWIDSIKNLGDKQIIYVPTEANLPVLEATRLKK